MKKVRINATWYYTSRGECSEVGSTFPQRNPR
jgi:hypothetical protein